MSAALQGKRIVNTRAVHQAGELDALLREVGAVPLAYPCIAIQPPADPSELDSALRQLLAGEYDWLLLTSANTVLSLAQRVRALGLSIPQTRPFQLAVVGPSTAQAAEAQLGLSADLVPQEFVAEALAAAVLAQGGRRVFLPESALARPTLAQTLVAGGAHVQVITAYETVRGSGGVKLAAELRQGRVDGVTFTSSSTVDFFMERLREESDTRPDLQGVTVACIGPKTARTAAEHGLQSLIVPEEYTLEGMVQAIASAYAVGL